MNSLTLKRHISFQDKHDRKSTHDFIPEALIFKLQQVLKSNDLYVS